MGLGLDCSEPSVDPLGDPFGVGICRNLICCPRFRFKPPPAGFAGFAASAASTASAERAGEAGESGKAGKAKEEESGMLFATLSSHAWTFMTA